MLLVVGFSCWFCFSVSLGNLLLGGGYFSSFPYLACFWAVYFFVPFCKCFYISLLTYEKFFLEVNNSYLMKICSLYTHTILANSLNHWLKLG